VLKGRHIVVGVTGGIAAYKAAELVRLFVKAGATVQVIMTRSAERFIGKLTLQALSTRKVVDDLFDADDEAEVGHIRIADEADLLVIAPATAHVLARLAGGLADDLLTTVALATKAPILVAPAMNVNMWDHPQTQANLAHLVARGVHVVGPGSGDLACGWKGSGRLIEPSEIAAAAETILAPGDLDGVPLLVTAGPTHEAVDPVRYIGNRSSGKMGFAVAARASARGAKVTLVSGPVALATPRGVERIDVTTATQMRDAVLSRADGMRVIVKAAAVADFRPAVYSSGKMKKGEAESMTLALERNPDILAELGERRRSRGGGPILVGFAAETADLELHAREKLEKKGCDLLVANDVTEPGSGFGTDTNRVILFSRDAAPEHLPQLAKERVADRILDWVVVLLKH
jgi:phosphopantothenoylcysteine decarboxylase/phosphopantothenate--cysteine ligase